MTQKCRPVRQWAGVFDFGGMRGGIWVMQAKKKAPRGMQGAFSVQV